MCKTIVMRVIAVEDIFVTRDTHGNSATLKKEDAISFLTINQEAIAYAKTISGASSPFASSGSMISGGTIQ